MRPRPIATAQSVVAHSLICGPVNPWAGAELPVLMDLCHVQRTIGACCIPQGFEQVQQVTPCPVLGAFFTSSTCEFSTGRFASHCTCALNMLSPYTRINLFTAYICDPHRFTTFSKGSTYYSSICWQIHFQGVLQVNIYTLLFCLEVDL